MGYLGFAIAVIVLLGAFFLTAKWGGKSGMAIYIASTLLLILTIIGTYGWFDIVFAEHVAITGILIGAFLLGLITYFLEYGTKSGIKLSVKIGGAVVLYSLIVIAYFTASKMPAGWFEYLYIPIALLALILTTTLAFYGILKLVDKYKFDKVLTFILLGLVAIICTIFYYLVFGLFTSNLVPTLKVCGIGAIVAVIELALGYFVYMLAKFVKKKPEPSISFLGNSSSEKTEGKKGIVRVASKAETYKSGEAKKTIVIPNLVERTKGAETLNNIEASKNIGTPKNKVVKIPAKKVEITKAPAKKVKDDKKKTETKKTVAEKKPVEKKVEAKKVAPKAPAKKSETKKVAPVKKVTTQKKVETKKPVAKKVTTKVQPKAKKTAKAVAKKSK